MDSLSLRIGILVLVTAAAPRKSRENGGTTAQHFPASARSTWLAGESDHLEGCTSFGIKA